MFRRRRWDWRDALFGMVLSAALATYGFVAGAVHRSELAHQRDVASCPPEQRFTPADCQFILNGTVTAVSDTEVDVVAEGRRLTVVGYTKSARGEEGASVVVTFYRGEPVRLAGLGFHVDARDTPTDLLGYDQAFQVMGVIGTVSTLVALLVALRRRSTASADWFD